MIVVLLTEEVCVSLLYIVVVLVTVKLEFLLKHAATSDIIIPTIVNFDKAIGVKDPQLVLATSHTFVNLNDDSNFVHAYRFKGHFKVEIILCKLLCLVVLMIKTKLHSFRDGYVLVFHHLKADCVIVWVIIFFEIDLKKNEH